MPKQNKNHQIDWEYTNIPDKRKDYQRRIIQLLLYKNAFRDEKVMNGKDGKLTIPIWKQFHAEIKLSVF